MSQKHQTPSSPEMERAVLAAIMRSGGSLLAISSAGGITDATFSNSLHRRVYGQISGISQAGGKPDLVAVCAAMPGEEVAIAEIDGSISTTVNFEHWVKSLRDIEAARDLQAAAIKFSDAAGQAVTVGAAGMVAEMAAAVSDAQRVIERCHVRTLHDVAREYADNLVNRNTASAVPWFPAASEGDFAVRHLPGRMYVLCAKTGCGKTALAVGAVREQLKKGLIVAYFCTESDSEGILARITSQFCGVPHHVVSDKHPDMTRVRTFAETMAKISDDYSGKLFIRGNETGTGSPDGIAAESKRIFAEAGRLDVIVVDYLQDLRSPRFLLKSSKNDQITYAVDRIHETLADCRSAGIVLAQLNREGLKTTGMPRLHHLRDSSTIEQKAHAVLFLHRDRDDSPVTKFYSDKARDQWPFLIDLEWDGVGYVSRQKYNLEG